MRTKHSENLDLEHRTLRVKWWFLTSVLGRSSGWKIVSPPSFTRKAYTEPHWSFNKMFSISSKVASIPTTPIVLKNKKIDFFNRLVLDWITSVHPAYHELQYFAGVMLIVSSSVLIRTFCQDRSRYVTLCHAITFLTLLTNSQKKLVLKQGWK